MTKMQENEINILCLNAHQSEDGWHCLKNHDVCPWAAPSRCEDYDRPKLGPPSREGVGIMMIRDFALFALLFIYAVLGGLRILSQDKGWRAEKKRTDREYTAYLKRGQRRKKGAE